MPRFSFFTWFRNISITRKLYFATGIMALLIAIELFTLWFAIQTLSAVRAYVEGEGLWSKSQKDAIYYLKRYARTYNEKDYQTYLEFMKVPMGDHKARLELLKPEPNLEIARQGLIEGRNHPNDVEGMINLFRRFHNISYINKAIRLWGEADEMIFQLPPLAEELHKEILDIPSEARINVLLDKMGIINEQVTKVEDDFSFTLGEGSRWLENIVLKLLFAVALTVEISGLLLTISVSRGIQKGLNEILRASKRIAKGDFEARAKSYSEDELGILADSFNHMADELQHSTEALKDYARKLEQSNDSLEQFAYVASHDLQEPLRTITNFAALLEITPNGIPEGPPQRYMKHIVSASNRMKVMVRDVLHYSRLGKQREMVMVDCDKIVKDILADMDMLIKENQAKIFTGELPVIKGSHTEIQQLFQNLIYNSIKYRKQDVPPRIEINGNNVGREWIFSVKDNGIGIERAYKDKIFIIFQRLHNHNEYSGTGIGLATCKKIVELNGGRIWVESEPGVGSTFYFTLMKS